MNADKTSVFIGVYRRSSAAIHVLAFFSNLVRWRVILLRLFTVAGPLGGPTVRERFPPTNFYFRERSVLGPALLQLEPHVRRHPRLDRRQGTVEFHDHPVVLDLPHHSRHRRVLQVEYQYQRRLPP